MVVVVGGGVIGLWCTYNLAQQASRHLLRVKLIEASKTTFAAAFPSCTDCFHYSFPEPQLQPLKPLGKYSLDLWEKIADQNDSDFRGITGYRPQSCHGIHHGQGLGLNKFPDCIQKDSTWNVDAGVLGVRNAMVSDLNPLHIECNQVLFACGPWTQTFLSFANLVGEKLGFAARNDGTIFVCGRRNLTAQLPPPTTTSLGDPDGEPDKNLITKLSNRAKERLNWNCTCTDPCIRPTRVRSGRLISRCLMHGEEPDIDVSIFTLEHQAENVAGIRA
ncbi:FAD dependent oxidoreductase superfamily [Podospora fimiseda]|uniref:FAD dependent oxidoreductase superfamily n=1 Tax=Podospora fimiseda TaxID=252190 RepID=A0AAN7BEZ2_9PEZI|nr:FAD dependent oxidoreductase superfamily [Podospora fimiseda]